MTLRFDIHSPGGETLQEGPLFPNTLQRYLASLRYYVGTNLAILVGVDPHADELFDGALVIALRDTAQRLSDELARASWDALPELCRPCMTTMIPQARP